MKPACLYGPDQTIIRKASRTAVQRYFSRQAAAGGGSFWLDPANRYRISATKTYAADYAASPSTINVADLVAYIAASGPTHAIDGWSYLARATNALLHGDLAASLHLAYYAELRAAMSILACEGVGVFNNRHPVISSSRRTTTTTSINKIKVWEGGKYVRKNAGTHIAVWPMLSHWGGLERAAGLVDTLVSPDGFCLRRWLDAMHIPSPVRAISAGWFESWGVDLTRLYEDHDSRNMVSYRPSEYRLAPAPCAPDAIRFVSELWRLFEPSTAGRFPALEAELLRRIVKENGVTVAAGDLQAAFAMTPAVASRWATFFNAATIPLPIELSEKQDDVEHTNAALEVISRAALLLFLATGSVRKHLVDAGYTRGMTDFFWKRQCEIRFCGPATLLPVDPIDLWQDIEDHIGDAELWRSSAAANASLGEWRKAQPSVMNQFASFELAGVWGFVS